MANITANFVPNDTDGAVGALPQPYENASASTHTVAIAHGTIFITYAGVCTVTLADPPANMNGARLLAISTGAYAHKLNNSSGSGFSGAGANSDVGTYGGAASDRIELVAYGGIWYVASNTNVTIGAS